MLQIGKVFHCVIASHLPITAYFFIRTLLLPHLTDHFTRDVGIMAAILVALSEPLAVMGTHSLVNSLLSVPTFVCVILIIRGCATDHNDKKTKNSNCGCLPYNKRSTDAADTALYSSISSSTTPLETRGYDTTPSLSVGNSTMCNNNGVHSVETSKSHKIRSKNQQIHKMNGSVHQPNSEYSSNRCPTIIDDRKRLKYPTKLNDILNKWCICYHRQANTIHRLNYYVLSNGATFMLLLCGCMLGIMIYMRIDLILLVPSLLAISVLSNHQVSSSSYQIIVVGLGALLGLMLGGYEDWLSYGIWFISPQQWFKFNVQKDLASVLFGRTDTMWYIKELMSNNNSLVLFTSCNVIVLTGLCISHVSSRHILFPPYYKVARVHIFLMLQTLCLLLLYSCMNHKELRFVHNALVLFLVTGALSLITILNTLTMLINKPFIPVFIKYFTLLGLLIYAHTAWIHFPSATNHTDYSWPYLGQWDSSDVNTCIDYVRRQHDVTGLYIDRSLHITGGYSLLHKDIPIFTLIHFEFQEFDKKCRVSINSRSVFTRSEFKSKVSVLGRISDFITVENTPLLLKNLLVSTEYNYWIVSGNIHALEFGFDEVYKAGKMRVLRRKTSDDINKRLFQIRHKIPQLQNTTILEYEVSWLRTFGLYSLALQRVRKVFDLETPSSARAYQLLMSCEIARGREEAAQAAYRSCISYHGDKQCTTPQPRIVLHHQYQLNLPQR